MKLALAVLLLAAVGCRLSVNKWGGAPPRASDHVKIALHDNGGGALAKRVLAADARVEIIAFDPKINEQQRNDCGDLNCPLALEPACKWAAHNGADYYAIASTGSAYSSTSRCTKSHTDWSKVLDKHGDSEICDESAITSEGTRGDFAIRVYDAVTCEVVPALSEQIQTYASGSKEESGVEAAMQLNEVAPTRFPGFPDQTTIGPDGHVVNAPGDGQYALFRNREFEGIARLRHTASAAEQFDMLMCCATPQPGDVLVKRGPMHYVELDVSLDALTFETSPPGYGFRSMDLTVAAVGPGIHLRHYALAGGLQVGGNAAAAISTNGNGNSVGMLSLDAGWGYHAAAPLHVSANVEAGMAKLMIGESPYAWTPYVLPQARVQLAFYWFYIAADLGYVLGVTASGADWQGYSSGPDMRLRGPAGRAYLGITL